MRGSNQLAALTEIAQERLNDPRNAAKGDWNEQSLYKSRWLLLVEFIELQAEFVKYDLCMIAKWWTGREIMNGIKPTFSIEWLDKKIAEILINVGHESADVVNFLMVVNDKHSNLGE